MYVAYQQWLRTGGAIEDADELEDQLISIEYHYDKKMQIQLMSKEDMRRLGRPSPDWGDAGAMTFAYPVSSRRYGRQGKVTVEYDPFSEAAFRSALKEEAMVH
jgi:hypothetical protein